MINMNFELIKSRLLDSIAEHFDDIAIGFQKAALFDSSVLRTTIKFNSPTALSCEMDASNKEGSNLFLYVVNVHNRNSKIWLSMSWIGETVEWFVSNASTFEPTDVIKVEVDSFLKIVQSDIFNEIKTIQDLHSNRL